MTTTETLLPGDDAYWVVGPPGADALFLLPYGAVEHDPRAGAARFGGVERPVFSVRRKWAGSVQRRLVLAPLLCGPAERDRLAALCREVGGLVLDPVPDPSDVWEKSNRRHAELVRAGAKALAAGDA